MLFGLAQRSGTKAACEMQNKTITVTTNTSESESERERARRTQNAEPTASSEYEKPTNQNNEQH